MLVVVVLLLRLLVGTVLLRRRWAAEVVVVEDQPGSSAHLRVVARLLANPSTPIAAKRTCLATH